MEARENSLWVVSEAGEKAAMNYYFRAGRTGSEKVFVKKRS
jgi:hypothetical protein